MELRHLRYFAAVADELHFGRAAERLGMTQPPLSQQIMDLERELGVTLFDRSRRSIALTKVGEMLLPDARRVLSAVERLRRSAAESSTGERGHLRVGVVHSALYGAVPGVLRRFSQAYPNVRLTVREAVTTELVDALHDDGLDVAFVRPTEVPPDVSTTELLSEPLVVAVPDSDPLAAGASVGLAQLEGQPLVLFDRELGPGYWDLIVSACADAGVTPRIERLADQVTTMVGLVAAGLGLSLVPEPVSNLQLPGVAYRPLSPRIELRLDLAWRSQDPFPVRDVFVGAVMDDVGRA